jgi:predicted deacylase
LPQILKVGNVNVRSGELAKGSLGTWELPDGSSVQLPVLVMNGAEDGPVFYMQGVAHGGELIGAEVIRRVVREEVNPSNLSGAIIAVPVANPLAFQWARRTTPIDDANLGSQFPGRPSGQTTERIATAIWEGALSKSNYMMDIHGNFPPCTAFILLGLSFGNEKTRERAEKMAEAFGLTIVYSPPRGGTTEGMGGQRSESGLAMENDIPEIGIELIDARRVTPASVDLGVRGVLNVLKSLGMVEGKIEKQPPEYTWGPGRVENAGIITASRGGIVHFTAEVGKLVEAGQEIAKVYNLYGDLVESLKMPHRGFIRAYTYRDHQAVATGDHVAYLTKDK